MNELLYEAIEKNDNNRIRDLVNRGVKPTIRELRHVILRGNLNALKLLATFENINVIDEKYGETLLFYAVSRGEDAMVKYLIGMNADVNAHDTEEWTPLMVAAFRNYPTIVVILIKAGAIQELTSKKGETALMIAAANGRLDALNLLISRKDLINRRNKEGNTALILAARNGHLNVIDVLIENNADLNVLNNHDRSALGIASVEAVVDKLLAAGAKPDVYAIIKAIEERELSIAEKLIKRQENPNARNKDGSTALIYASYYGQEKIVKLLIDAGADAGIKNTENKSAIDYAIERDNHEVIKLLRARKPKVDIFEAIDREDLELIEELIDNGLDFNECDSDGNTPILAAIDVNLDARVLEKMIKACKKIDNEVLDRAISLNNSDAVRILLKHGVGAKPASRTNMTTEFINAIVEHDRESLRTIIATGFDVDSVNKDGMSGLTIAILMNDKDMVKLLIDAKANVNRKDTAGATPLMFAMEHGNREIIEMLIDAGANINEVDENGASVLFYAIGRNKEKIAKMLIQKGAILDVDAIRVAREKGYDDMVERNTKKLITDLVEMLEMGDLDVIKNVMANFGSEKKEIFTMALFEAIKTHKTLAAAYLIESGADIEAALEYATKYNNITVVEKLIKKGVDVNTKTSLGTTALMIASEKGYARIVDLLVKAGASFSGGPQNSQDAALYAAVVNLHPEIVKILLDAGAVVTNDVIEAAKQRKNEDILKLLKGTNVKKSLMEAVMSEDIEGVRAAIRSGADVNEKNKNGHRPLTYAALFSYLDIVKLLVSHGANIELTTYNNATPLICACMESNTDVAEFLIRKGANINARTKDNMTPMKYAMSVKNQKIIDMLTKPDPSSLIRAAYYGYDDEIKHVTDTEIKDEYGESLLMIAVKGGHESTVKMLLEMHADVNAVDKFGNTPLMRAVLGGDNEILKLLIDAGANVNTKSNNGYTPIAIACREKNLDIIKTLIDAGAEIDDLAVMYARMWGSREILKLLNK